MRIEFAVLLMFIFGLMQSCVSTPKLDNIKYKGSFHPNEKVVQDEFFFNGYTTYWHNTHQEWTRYGNLFKIVAPNVEYAIAQSKMDMAVGSNISKHYLVLFISYLGIRRVIGKRC
ncbi:MAG: hypothetical protein ABI325_09155 [Ginsengibacter sp.]